MEVYAVRYPASFAGLANRLNPCFTGPAKSDTVTEYHTDTLIAEKQVFIKGANGKPDTVKLPGRIFVKTVTNNIHDTITNNRAIADISGRITIKSDSLIKINQNLANEKSDLSTWRLIALISGGLLLILIVITVYKFVTGGWATGIIRKL